MESIKQSMSEMSEFFHKKMAEFEQDLQKAPTTQAAGHSSKVPEDFQSFKSFVVFALTSLQKQLDMLSLQYDTMEMRSRRKMLLLHGVPEDGKADIQNTAALITEHLDIPDVPVSDITKCVRLGFAKSDKPRPLLVKFKDVGLRNKIWFAKTGLKGTGVTLSEFLTKGRHKIFLGARQRFGVSKCWTKDGCIHVVASDGSRHRAVSMADLDGIPRPTGDACVPSASVSAPVTNKTAPISRVKKTRQK